MKLKLIFAALFGAAFLLGGIVFVQMSAQATSTRAERAISDHTPKLSEALRAKGFAPGAPIFLRIVKSKNGTSQDGYLEAFIQNDSGTFEAFKRWDICTWSGDLGPKLREGDGQSPEGFYFVKPAQMNPNSSYHLSFNLGFPNAYDRSRGRTGSFLMVHGNCVSIGCYAMTDAGIEEIYTLMTMAFEGGQPFVRVHVFPFEMTDENMARQAGHVVFDEWVNFKQGWDWFETTQTPPNVQVTGQRYVFNAATP